MWRVIHCDFQFFIVLLPVLHEPLVCVLRRSDRALRDVDLLLRSGILDFVVSLAPQLLAELPTVALCPVQTACRLHVLIVRLLQDRVLVVVHGPH